MPVTPSNWYSFKYTIRLSATAASTLDYTYTKTASFDGKQMVAYCEIKTANTYNKGVQMNVRDKEKGFVKLSVNQAENMYDNEEVIFRT